MEIEQRLGLYQVFLKLYEHHRTLLDEILQLEKTTHKSFSGIPTRYVTGIVQNQQAYLVTNLAGGKTRILLQLQGIWTIGRDRQLSISIADRRLSRHHAAIQYIEDDGFYLVDLDSTNGSFINGEPVHGRMPLRDGDRVRLSSLAFSFFQCDRTEILDETPPDILAKLVASTARPTPVTPQPSLTPPPERNSTTSSVAQQEAQLNYFLCCTARGQIAICFRRIRAGQLSTRISAASVKPCPAVGHPRPLFQSANSTKG